MFNLVHICRLHLGDFPSLLTKMLGRLLKTLRTEDTRMANVSHMVLPVSDVHKSRDWYANKLGFKVEREHEGAVGIKDQSGLTIFLQKTADSVAGQKITLTIQVDNVDTKHQELASQGVQFVSPPKRQFWGYGAEVLDPDGYTNHLWDEVTMAKAMRET
jgi:catechol 2,3-dioxygenase-like lactoylglutathione lyase family enzyme